MILFCHKCDTEVKQDRVYVSGCQCDPDAPTWCAITPDGRLMAMSHAKYTIKEQ